MCQILTVDMLYLQGSDLVNKRPVLTENKENIDCGLVLRSIGYKSIQVDQSIPFDERKGVVLNKAGRVTDSPGN